MPCRRLVLIVSCLAFGESRTASADGDATQPAAATLQQTEFFEKRVRPILAARCFECHGEKKQEFGLRLDTRDGLLKGSDGGPVVIPGKPDESSLVEAIGHEGAIKMPPKGKLPAVEINALTEWVRQGAPWPESAVSLKSIAEAAKSHWAFQPVRRPPLPSVVDKSWSRTPIDRFILAKLEANGLRPSREADRRTLLRRLSFDLLGLPPTVEEAEHFLSDDRPDAYERLVERTLGSPHYGERWARHWLDVARYADTKGYVFFEDVKFPWAWTYRDYVVRAFNEDLPYDRFLREQIAADQLDLGGDPRPLAALGFLTDGGRFMNNQHDILDDRIDVVARGILGLTIGCARCHDHKFDPIPAADYYSLYGVFRSSSEPVVPPLAVPTPDTDEYRKFDAELQVRRGRLDAFVNQKFTELVNGGRTRVGEYLLKAHSIREQPSTEEFMVITDKGELNPTMIVRWQKHLDEAKKSRHPVWVAWHRFADADVPATQSTGGAAAANTTFAERSAAIVADLARVDATPASNRLVREAFVGAPVPQSMADVAQRYAKLFVEVDRVWSAVSAVAEVPPGVTEAAVRIPTRLDDDAAEELRGVLYGPDAPPDLPRMLGWGFLSLLPDRPSQEDFKKLLKEVETHLASGPGAPPRAMVLVDDSVPYDPRVFLRGNPNRPGREVPRQAPAIAAPNRRPFQNGSGRRELADALVAPDNPLTPRVIVNRLWLHHFGQGLVSTAGDFGLRSDPPSHPELLDWLACEIADGGWRMADSQTTSDAREPSSAASSNPQSEIRHPQSPAWSLKRIHRLIVLSAVYRQESGVGHLNLKSEISDLTSQISDPTSQIPEPSAAPLADSRSPNPPASNPQSAIRNPQSKDPENRLLWRQNRRRLDFESLRDAVIVASGTLDATLGGPPVPILAMFTPRRTLYGSIDRQDLAPLYRDFDFPDPSASSPQREATTVPPQALYLMNNVFALEGARRVVDRPDVRRQTTVEPRLDQVGRILFSRPLTTVEKELATTYLGSTPNETKWLRYVHALMLTNEFAFVD